MTVTLGVVLNFALALLAPALLLDACLTLGVQLFEADRGRRVGRREDPHGDRHQADLHEPFPGRASRPLCELSFCWAVSRSGFQANLIIGPALGFRYRVHIFSLLEARSPARPILGRKATVTKTSR